MENTDLNELAPPDADRTATALPSSSSSVGGAAAVEANVPLPASNKSNPMNSNSSSNDDMLDPDIDIAAEQIVNEFASHLSKDAAIFDNKDIMDDDDDIKEGDEVGVMSHSLAAGGFEELIAAFDEEEEEEVEEEVEEEEEHTEEIVDESYEEEEITEEEIIESDEIKEIILNPMENSNIITEDSARSAQSRKIHVIHPDVEMNIDAAEDMVVDDDCPNQGPPVVEPAVDDVSENQATSVGASGSINNSVGGSSSVNKHSDGIPMELSPASLSSAQKSIAGSMVSEKTDGPSGDALLGDMSELSAQSSQHGSFRNNQSERSTASVKSLKSMFSNKSTRSQASAAQQSLKSYQSSQKTPSVAHSTSAQSKESTNSSQRFTAVPPATAAIVASVAAESMGSDATDTIPQDAARHAPGRDPSGTAAGLIPVEQATSGIDPDVDATEQDYEEVEIDDSEVMEEEIEELKVEEKEDHELEKGEDQDSKVERQTYETPIPPGMGGMTSVEDAAPSQEIDPYKDLELGGPIATNAEDRAKQESATDSKQPVEPVEIERSSRTPLLITGVICFVVIMAIILSVVLTQGNDSDRGDVPTFPPSPGQAPGIAPVRCQILLLTIYVYIS